MIQNKDFKNKPFEPVWILDEKVRGVFVDGGGNLVLEFESGFSVLIHVLCAEPLKFKLLEAPDPPKNDAEKAAMLIGRFFSK